MMKQDDFFPFAAGKKKMLFVFPLMLFRGNLWKGYIVHGYNFEIGLMVWFCFLFLYFISVDIFLYISPSFFLTLCKLKNIYVA